MAAHLIQPDIYYMSLVLNIILHPYFVRHWKGKTKRINNVHKDFSPQADHLDLHPYCYFMHHFMRWDLDFGFVFHRADWKCSAFIFEDISKLYIAFLSLHFTLLKWIMQCRGVEVRQWVIVQEEIPDWLYASTVSIRPSMILSLAVVILTVY